MDVDSVFVPVVKVFFLDNNPAPCCTPRGNIQRGDGLCPGGGARQGGQGPDGDHGRRGDVRWQGRT